MRQATPNKTSKLASADPRSIDRQRPLRSCRLALGGAWSGRQAPWARLRRLALAMLWVLLLGACGSSEPQPDLVIGAQGCNTQSLTLAPNQQPQLIVENTASEPMVVSLPNWNNVITVAPGARAVLALEPYAWGDVDFYCLTEHDHTLASGGPMPAGFVCGLDPYAIRPLALSSGVLRVAKHDRLRAALGG